MSNKHLAFGTLLFSLLTGCSDEATCAPSGDIPVTGPFNIVFILSDDHRYDFMGFTGKIPGQVTPNMAKMAREGIHFRNAFVTTALCSPSRASILTGQYAHTHEVVDNYAPLPERLVFFPEYLKQKGYQTAFIGKWHMGNEDDQSQPGFDHWVSFPGQGVYYGPTLNVDGKEISYPDTTYITDLLTDHALNWIDSIDKNRPFFLYLSHKASHASFLPAKRYENMYRHLPVRYPPTMFLTMTDSSTIRKPDNLTMPEGFYANLQDIPEWVREQRYSGSGVDYMFRGNIVFEEFYYRYLETIQGIDESIGSIMTYLIDHGLENNTIVFYMSDNGFSAGEHGLIDKRHMYEESMRIPLLVWAPGMEFKRHEVEEMVLNIDIAPTILEIAGIKVPRQMQGQSFFPILQGKEIPWRDKVFYEYYWEYALPQTPTFLGVRGNRYKFIFTQGRWDINEFYDLQQDPWEANNLIRKEEFQDMIKNMADAMWTWLEDTGGLHIPLKRIEYKKIDHKYNGTY